MRVQIGRGGFSLDATSTDFTTRCKFCSEEGRKFTGRRGSGWMMTIRAIIEIEGVDDYLN